MMDPRVWIAVIVLLVAAYAGGRLQQDYADMKAFNAERTKLALSAAQEQVKAVDDARQEEQRRTNAQSEIANAAQNDADKARTDADAARDAADRLRVQLANLRKDPGSSNPASTGPSKAADGSGDVLADLFLESVERNRELAAYADSARIAGLACQSSYETLTQK